MGLSASKLRKQYVVIVEGNIGIGKSTALNALKEKGFTVVTEPVEDWVDFKGINFLSLYTSDMTKWAFTFQTMALYTLWNKQMEKLNNPEKIIIVERSVHSVVKMFAANQVRSGFMHHEQYVLLEEMANSLSKLSKRKEVFIYLKGDPKLAFKRSNSRGREEESIIPLEYFQDLHNTLENWMKTEGKLQAVVDSTQTSDAVQRDILRAISQLE